MLKITAEEIHFIIYQYLHESGKLLQYDCNQTLLSVPSSNSIESKIIDFGRQFDRITNLNLFRLRTLVICIRLGGQYARK